jgi:branched-chain amino acid transport system ATP-binding protein
MTALLEVEDLHAAYGPVEVLRGLSFAVQEGETVALLGANGAGKTTTLRAICGMVRPRGQVRFGGRVVSGQATEKVVRHGIAHVPEGRGTFGSLTVEENLRLGAYPKGGGGIQEGLKRSYALFPRLEERAQQRAGSLSGGEQQMLAIARALMSRPRLMLLDEPSLGLAPLVTRELFGALQQVKTEEGVTMLIVEQNANLVLRFANHAHVLETGEIAVSGDAERLMGDEKMRQAYLGY